jgi:GNAT superfamily N-acetyltransferase
VFLKKKVEISKGRLNSLLSFPKRFDYGIFKEVPLGKRLLWWIYHLGEPFAKELGFEEIAFASTKGIPNKILEEFGFKRAGTVTWVKLVNIQASISPAEGQITYQHFSQLTAEEQKHVWDDIKTWRDPESQEDEFPFFGRREGELRWALEDRDAIIAFENGRPVGALGFQLFPSSDDARGDGLFVLDEARGRGIALKLCSELLRYLKEKKYKIMTFNFQKNDRIQKVTQKMIERWGAIMWSFPGKYPDGKIHDIAFDLRKYNPDEHLGGIDLTPARMNLQTQNIGEGIKFHLDPAMLAELQNAPGFVPVIINIEPMTDLRRFLEVR